MFRRPWLASLVLLALASLLRSVDVAAADPAAASNGATSQTPSSFPASSAGRAASGPASVDACRDFYAFTNGEWLASVAIPPDRASWGAFSELDRKTKGDLRDILDASLKDEASLATPGQRKVVQFYRSGMDAAAIERAGIEPIAPELARIARIRDAADLVDALAYLHRRDVTAAFQFTFTTDPKDSSRYLPELYQAGLALPDRDDYFRSDEKSVALRNAYLQHVQRTLELVGEPASDAARDAATVLRLETLIAKDSMTRAQRRDPQAITHVMAVSDLARIAPGIDWGRYLRGIGIDLADHPHLNVAQPGYFRAVAEALAREPIEDWKAYLRWQLVHATATKLPSRFVDEEFRFFGIALDGRKELAPRDERVISQITGRFGSAPLAMALSELYVAKRFGPEAKARALRLVEDERAVLRERIASLEWMTEPTRRAALRKLDAMDLKIGYPDRWRDYSGLELDGKAYAAQWLAANAFETDRRIALIRKPVDRREWFTSPHLVNAFYQPQTNSIVFPAAILQPPFFDPDGDDAANYGGIGMVVGHEITHGFDDSGRQFDERGNLRDWWSPEDARAYLARAERVSSQYGAYIGVDDLALNPKLTLGENIADIGGLKIAYLAMRRALDRQGSSAVDPAAADRRFFTAFARVWRTKMTPELERRLIQSDTHSPPRFRVRGALANMPEFAKAFSCPAEGGSLHEEAARAAIW